ncbi:hypothetical protein TNCV_265901 [Trichonephila clavipes]|nr:hypothetical protein TNCV_265901 [Trichonephila clavipes]
MSSFLVLSDGDTRNRWRDGQVCPDVGQGTMAPWARRLGRREEKGKKERRETERKGRSRKRRERESRRLKESRGERERSSPCMEKRAESGDWSEKDDERRFR